MAIFIVNGKPGVGKDRFCSKVIDIMTKDKAIVFSTVDVIKKIAKQYGWDGEKNLKSRKFLSDLKKTFTAWNDLPVQETIKNTKNFLEVVEKEGTPGCSARAAVFIMCREPEEITRLCDELGAKSILVTRDSVDSLPTSNDSDANVFNYNYDIVINNNGNLKDLALRAIEFVKEEDLFHYSWKELIIDSEGEIYYN